MRPQRSSIGPPARGAVAGILQWPELIPVTDLASARQPIEVIVEQGQGAWIMPHSGAVAGVVEGLLAVQQAPTVDPRPGCSVGSQKRRKREEGGSLIRPVVLVG
jgi:hypothetical protein